MPILDYLARSAASTTFRTAVEHFVRTEQPNAHVAFEPHCPPVKVGRTLIRVLEAYPELEIERVAIDAESGCEFFTGRAVIRAAASSRVVSFEWNCRWKAEQMGWVDWFGLPDQGRAAREFGHDCFRVWSEEPAVETAPWADADPEPAGHCAPAQ